MLACCVYVGKQPSVCVDGVSHSEVHLALYRNHFQDTPY